MSTRLSACSLHVAGMHSVPGSQSCATASGMAHAGCEPSLAGFADPLVMDNGQDLVAMCCHAYESPDGADEEEEELVDYCE